MNKSILIRRCRLLVMVVVVALAGCNGSSNPSGSPTGPGPSAAVYMLSGAIAEPTGEAVAGVRVQVGERSATTDEAGRYTIGELSGPLTMQVSKDGHETQAVSVTLNRDRVVNVALPRTVRIPAGEALTVSLHPNDAKYDFPHLYEECSAPCKRIRVTVPGRGSLSVKLTAHDLTRWLLVFTNEGSGAYSGSAQVVLSFGFADEGEKVLYVTFDGGLQGGSEQRIDISTSFQLH